MRLSVILSILLLALITSCSITPRRYLPGYYVSSASGTKFCNSAAPVKVIQHTRPDMIPERMDADSILGSFEMIHVPKVVVESQVNENTLRKMEPALLSHPVIKENVPFTAVKDSMIEKTPRQKKKVKDSAGAQFADFFLTVFLVICILCMPGVDSVIFQIFVHDRAISFVYMSLSLIAWLVWCVNLFAALTEVIPVFWALDIALYMVSVLFFIVLIYS